MSDIVSWHRSYEHRHLDPLRRYSRKREKYRYHEKSERVLEERTDTQKFRPAAQVPEIATFYRLKPRRNDTFFESSRSAEKILESGDGTANKKSRVYIDSTLVVSERMNFIV